MKQPTVFGGILVAAVLSLGSIPLRTALNMFFAPDMVVRMSIILLALAYCFWTLAGRVRRVGTVTIGTTISALFLAAIIFQWSVISVLWIAVAVTWFTRAIGRYQSISIAWLDGAIAICAVIVASVVLGATSSATIAIWCYFLMVALTALLPVKLPEAHWSSTASQREPQSQFEQAFGTAEAALREIVRRQAV